MGKIKGQVEWEKFKAGKKLTRAKAMKALCYECNGYEESKCDCEAKGCPMYDYRLYPGKKAKIGVLEV